MLLLGGIGTWTPSSFAQEASLAPAATPPPLPPVVARYEQMLIISPAKGTAFDKVYQHFFENEGLDALAARWQARANTNGDASPSFLLLQGLLAERRARPADARKLYQQYTTDHPDDPRGWTALGELESTEGRFGPSAEALAHALAPDAKPPVPVSARPTLYRELARAQTRNFLAAAALTTWRKLAAEFPDDPSVLQEVAEAFQEGEAYDEARQTFEKLRDMARSGGDAFGRVNATLRLGQIEEARGHAKEAVAIYEGVVGDAKAGSWLEREARARIEQLYRGQEDLPGLAEYYRKWLDDHPRDVEVATRRSAVLIELNRKAEAIDLLRQAVAWAPDRQELQAELTRRLLEGNRSEEAAAVMEKLTAVAPEEKSYWELLGDARWQRLDTAPPTLPPAEKAKLKTGALDAWGHLALPDSKDVAAVGQLADLFAKHRLADEALVQYARAASLAPDLPDSHEHWAAYLAQLGRKDEARRVLAGIVSADPKNAAAANYARLAAALDRLEDLDGALEATAKGLALEPHNFDLLAQRWQELSARKRWDDALALYPAMLAAAPNSYFADQVQTRQISALSAANKLADLRKTLSERIGAAPPATPLDENELSLLIRADLQTGDEGAPLDEAKRALAEGRARFPGSVTLVRLEGELAKRGHDPEGQVAALRRLIDLQPAQKTDALQEIVRVWRDADRTEQSLTAANELLAASPASASSHLLLADLLLQSGHADEAIARLQEAVRLSDKPNEVRLRLARTETDLGRTAEARQVLDAAFEAAADAHERLSLTKPLADAYQRDNRLDELISRFQHLQQAEADGWRYALYLAEIYQQTLDYGAARRELSKALAARPKDPALLRQIVRLATEEQNSAEVARYQAQLVEVEPSDANQFALVEALLDNNQSADALDALRVHLTAVLKIPGAWDDLLPLLAKNKLTAQAGELLTRELGGEHTDLKARFTMALFQVAAGNLDQARTALWSIFAEKVPPHPLATAPPPPVSTAASAAYGAYYFLYDDSALRQREREGEQSRYVAQQIITPGNGYYRNRMAYSGMARPNGPDPVDTARDTALIYLAAIAVKENAAPAFLAELDRQLAARDSARADRLIAYSLVKSIDRLLSEAAAQVRDPQEGLDRFCFTELAQLASNNSPQYRSYSNYQPLTAEQENALATLYEPLLTRLTQGMKPDDADTLDMARFTLYRGVDQAAKAEELRHKILARSLGATPIKHPALAMQMLLEGHFSTEERAQLKTVCQALTDESAKSKGTGSQSTAFQFSYYPLMLFQQDSAAEKLPPADFADVLATLLTLWYPAAPPLPNAVPSRSSQSYGYRFPGSGPREPGYLPPTRFLDGTMLMQCRQLAQQLGQGDGDRLKEFTARLHKQADELQPASRRLYPRLIGLFLEQAAGNPAAALASAQTLLAEQPEDNDLRLLTGVLLGKNDHPAEALAMLNTVGGARFGETAIALDQQILLNAKAAHDTETARRTALKLVNLRLPPEDRTALAEDLRDLGLKEKADQIVRATPATASNMASRPTSIFDWETTNQFQKLKASKNDDATLALARNVLAALPPPDTAYNADYVVRQAVTALQQLKKVPEFAADLEKQLAKDPDSLSLNYQLAMLHEYGDQTSTTEKSVQDHKAPLWIKVARVGEEVVGSYSADGADWTELGRANVALGNAPLAGLPAAAQPVATHTTDAIVDHVTLTPESVAAANGNPPSGEAALPAPWTEIEFPDNDRAPSDTPPPVVPPSSWKDGVFTLRAHGWDLWGRYDNGRLVYRPLGEGTEFAAHMNSVDGGPIETKTGVMLRADLAPDAPYAAMIVKPGGMVTFQHRDRTDQTTPYLRKLVALRPKETKYGALLARKLASRNQRAEAIALYDALIASDPDGTLPESSNLRTIYGQAHLADLTDRMLAWKQAPAGQNGRSRSFPSYSFNAVAQACIQQKRPEQAIALCQRGIEMDNAMSSGFLNTESYALLLRTLVAQHRRDEARETLLAFYVPSKDAAGSTSGSAAQLGFGATMGRQTYNNQWMRTSWSQDRVSIEGLGPLESGAAAGLLPELQTALVQEEIRDTKLFESAGLDWLLTLVRADLRDPALVDELPGWLVEQSAKKDPNNGNGDPQARAVMCLELAQRLRKWPGHEALALEAYHAAHQIAFNSQARGYNSYVMPMIAYQEARGELQLGDLGAVRAVAGDLLDQSKTPRGSGSINLDTPRRGLWYLSRAGAEADKAYVEAYDQVMQNPNAQKNIYFAYGLEKSQRTGDNPHLQAMAWLLDDGANTPEATLVYELRVQHPYDKGDHGKYPGARGRSFAGLEGERTLTFHYGPDAEHFAPIGKLKTSNTFGTWTGPVPPGGGALKVTIDIPRPADAAIVAENAEIKAKESPVSPGAPGVKSSPAPGDGPAPSPSPTPGPPPGDYWLRVVRAPNLMVNPGFEGLANRDPAASVFALPGWDKLPAGFWRTGTEASPRPGRAYVQCEPSDRQEQTVAGARIPVEPGHAYFQSGWLQDTGDGSSIHLGRRYLDAEGTVLKTSECPPFSTLIWYWQSHRLRPGGDGKEDDAIPPQTAFIEPFVRFQGAVAWTGLFVGRMD